jgi:hypothetical protein
VPAIGMVYQMSRPGHGRHNAAMEFERRAGRLRRGVIQLQGLTNPSIRGPARGRCQALQASRHAVIVE